MEREIFKNNKIVEAACLLNFKIPQDNSIFGIYWEQLQIQRKFTSKENLAIINPTNTDKPNEFIFGNSMKYTSEDKNKVIQLHRSSISFHQVGKYEIWESFKEDITEGMRHFNNISPGTISRFDL
ncbi:MAG: TIGR04255 family protein [Chitinophagales bacterium]|nr:TIGR04255 family protein [Chitinophagales bacterium]